MDDRYVKLQEILDLAFAQATSGKGKERHADNNKFENQPICAIGRMVGTGYTLGQAMKKTQESQRLLEIKGSDAAIAELLGAINYLAASIILIGEQANDN